MRLQAILPECSRFAALAVMGVLLPSLSIATQDKPTTLAGKHAPATEAAATAVDNRADLDRRMAITIDDLPAQGAQGMSNAELRELTNAIVGVLESEKIPGIGFVNEKKLERDGVVEPERVAILERWLDGGQELGNHTYSHPSLHEIPLQDYQREIVRGEQILRPMLAKRDTEPRYFRHPYLRTGLDLDTRDKVHAFLAEHGYQVAPVTVDNSEWIYARAYDRARRGVDPELAQKVGESYLDYMMSMVKFYEDQSRQLFDREIPQTLLIHANSLNATYLQSLVDRLTRHGYRFVSLEEALKDLAYASDDTYTGPAGITWLHRWALTQKVDPTMFRGEPVTPEWIQQVADIRK